MNCYNITLTGEKTTAKNDRINDGKRFHTFPLEGRAGFSEVPARATSTDLLRCFVCWRSSLFCMQYEIWLACVGALIVTEAVLWS
jgi:hypothetical protein